MLWKRILFGVLIVGLTMSIANAQQTRIITGTVTEAVTNEPVPGATVLIKNTSVGAITELDGSFTLAGAPTGEVVLEISSASHQIKEMVVTPEQSNVQVELSLAQAEEIVITGRAPQIFRKNLANGASVVQGEALTEVPSQTISSAMQGKIAGANIQSNSGAPGGGIQIQLRGVSTIRGRATPLYVIDGVVASDAAIANGINVVTASAGGSNASNQDNPVNRIADINPNDIESVEVLKGAAAAALYGSKASNGVILITTKRGRAGKTTVNVSQTLGFSQVSNRLGSRTFETEQEVIDTYCPDPADCPQLAYFRAGEKWDHEDQITETRAARETNLSVSGGNDKTKYFISGSVRDEPGVLRGTGYSKETARLAIDQDFGDRLKISVTTNVMHSNTKRGLTNNDNAGVSHYVVLSSTPSFIDLRPYDDGTYPINPFVGSTANPLQIVDLMEEDEEVWRTITSLNANLKLYSDDNHSLAANGILGIDRFQLRSDLFFPRELTFEPLDELPGTSLNSTAEVRNLNTGVSLLHTFVPATATWQAATSTGFFYENIQTNTNRIFAQGLTAGVNSVGVGVNVDTPQARTEEKDVSVFLQEEVLMLEERLTLLGAILADKSSVNGDPDKFFFYPKASVTYRVPTEGITGVDLVRPRIAYGETGNKPNYCQTCTNLNTGNAIDGNGGIINGGIAGNSGLKPERQREIEVGVDVTGVEGRVVLELTAYQRMLSDLLLTYQTAPSTGTTQSEGNYGGLRNRGLELMFQATPVRTPDFQWVTRTTLSINRSQITELTVPEFLTGGFGTGLGAFCIEKGQSATQIVGDVAGATDEMASHCGAVNIGDTEPSFRVSFVHDFSFKGVTLHTLLDWQQGSKVINLTELLYDLASNTVDFETEGMQRIAEWGEGNAAPYVQDASFLKLREVSLSYDVPRELMTQLSFAQSARFVLSARNLLTVTPYRGLDPEVSNFGSQAIARNIDVAPYPPSRSFWFTLEAGF